MPRRRLLRETNLPLYGEEDDNTKASGGQDAWALDQLTKSDFFHRKLHEWGLIEVARQIEEIKGETLEWDAPGLGISPKAWDKIIHRGIRPVIVFAHPHTLNTVPRSIGYYRMLAMVSQKSMNRIGLATARYEEGSGMPDVQSAEFISYRLNNVISRLIESDEEMDAVCTQRLSVKNSLG